jgi:hypothetical protein
MTATAACTSLVSTPKAFWLSSARVSSTTSRTTTRGARSTIRRYVQSSSSVPRIGSPLSCCFPQCG